MYGKWAVLRKAVCMRPGMNSDRSVGTMALPILAALLLAGCASQVTGTLSSWYQARKSPPPTSNTIYICHAFGCAHVTPVRYDAASIAALRHILARGAASAKAERHAVSEAVQWNERHVGKIVGSDKDKGGLDLVDGGVPGQMDCLDEATNTTSLLLFAETHGMLRYHTVASPVARGFFLDGRYPHATAVLRETASGAYYAVDSWPRANGERPDIMPLPKWMATYPS